MSKSETTSIKNPSILIEAEDFENYGGWVLDSQFETQMGSPYLMAHGLGRPVEDATTIVPISNEGKYEVWVRAKDWAPGHHPGRFALSIDGQRLDTEFGANGQDWSWQSAGHVDLQKGDIRFALHDLTGFNGRCDAIFLSPDGIIPNNEVNEDSRRWRKKLRGIPEDPIDAGNFDVVVVGGGVSGCAAALTAARLGQKTALIQDRPVLGGNASKEIGLMPRGTQGALLEEFTARTSNGDLMAERILQQEPNATIFLEQRVLSVKTEGDHIISVDAVETRGGKERRIKGDVFIDTTGVAVLGMLAGAETLFGREARSEYNESYAPEEADEMHHGNTLFFRTKMSDQPITFPDVPWATEISKDYANLSGQLIEPGLENGPGPTAGDNPNTPVFQFTGTESEFPATHFWEYGQWLDPYKEAEHIRDYLMCALFGTFSNVKRLEPEKHANLEFEWMAFVAAQGEFRRYKGDYILSENDVRKNTSFDDVLVYNDGSFCIHCAGKPGEDKYDFRLKDWIFDGRDKQPYGIPFRCLYSSNINNLMMAGKHISVTYVAGTSTKFMGNGAQHGLAVAAAASLCKKYDMAPRGLYENRLSELKELVAALTNCDDHKQKHPEKRGFAPDRME